jgi:hypothetical protein
MRGLLLDQGLPRRLFCERVERKRSTLANVDWRLRATGRSWTSRAAKI